MRALALSGLLVAIAVVSWPVGLLLLIGLMLWIRLTWRQA